MGQRRSTGGGQVIDFASIGPQIENGYEVGGGRFYPWDGGLALSPPSFYSDYLGTGSGVPTAPPAGALPDTIGTYGESSPNGAEVEASAHPFGRTSPLPWVLAGLAGALLIGHYKHYE